MPLQYPLAANARAALDSEIGARTIAEARELAGGSVELVSDFVRPAPAEPSKVPAMSKTPPGELTLKYPASPPSACAPTETSLPASSLTLPRSAARSIDPPSV